MEKYIPVSFTLTKEQAKKIMQIASDRDESASHYLRKLIDKLPEPKKRK